METPDIAVTLSPHTTPDSAGEGNTTAPTVKESSQRLNRKPPKAPKSSSSETLTPKPESSEIETPPSNSFVPPLIDRTEDEPGCRLYSMGHRWGLSIESAELVFTHNRGRDRDRSVHGTIYINAVHRLKVYPLYKRSSGEAETVSGGRGHLSLCGPKYFVDIYSPTALYVDLREVGNSSPLIYERVLLPLDGLTPGRNVPVFIRTGEATLTIFISLICPAIPTAISLELSYPDSYNEWLVSGSVTAIQVLRKGKTRRSVRLFNRRADDPMRAPRGDPDVSPGRHKASISPHRSVFVSPLWFEKSYIEKMDKVLEARGRPSSGMDSDNDGYNGVGSYLSVDVDLKFVDSVDAVKTCIVQGVLRYQFKCSHENGAVFRAFLKGPVLKEKKDSIIDPDEIELVLTLVPYVETSPDMEEELYEKQMSLYVEYTLVVSDDDTDSSSDDYVFCSSDDEESEDDEEMLPVPDQFKSKDEEMLPSIHRLNVDVDVDEESNKPIAHHK